jgi:hypothetical protein
MILAPLLTLCTILSQDFLKALTNFKHMVVRLLDFLQPSGSVQLAGKVYKFEVLSVAHLHTFADTFAPPKSCACVDAATSAATSQENGGSGGCRRRCSGVGAITR